MKRLIFFSLILTFLLSIIVAQGTDPDLKITIPKDYRNTPTSVIYTYSPTTGLFTPVQAAASGALIVSVRDEIAPVVLGNFNQVVDSSVTTEATVIGETTVVVDDTTGTYHNKYVIIFSSVANRFYVGTVLSIGANSLTLDTPFDFAFPVGSNINYTNRDMNVDGSSTTQVFGVRGQSADTITTVFDVTRIIITCVTDTPVDLTKFGDLTALTNGLVLRKRDGVYQNIFNVKSNQELAGIMYDFTVEAATNPAQGVDGFVARLTFGGKEKLGAVIRLNPGEDLEFLVQDDLTDLTSLRIVGEGHIAIEE